MPGPKRPNIFTRLFGTARQWFFGRPKPAAQRALPQAVAFRGPGSAPLPVVASDPPTGSRLWTFPPIRVRSSNIFAIAYRYETRTLEVSFKDKDTDAPKSVYHYDGVPLTLYQGLMSAPSHGVYLNRFIKNPKGRYPYRQVV